jgi:hypothetical protein
MALLRGRPWAQKALYLPVGWFGLVGPAVVAMAIAMAPASADTRGGGAACDPRQRADNPR